MRVASWVTNVTNTHTDCVIHIAYPLSQSLHELASMLRYTCIVGLLKKRLASNERIMPVKFFTQSGRQVR